MRDNNRRFKIHPDDRGPSKGATILFQVGRYSVTHHPTSLELAWDLGSRNYSLDHLGANKSFKVRMFTFRELEHPTDALDDLIHTLRNDKITSARLKSVKISTNINTGISEKLIIEKIDDGVI